MNDSTAKQTDSGPWYKQFWAWFVLAPLILVMLAWIPFMTIALKSADDRVIDNYYKEGRMYNQRVDEDLLALQLGLQGTLTFDLDVGDLLLNISHSDVKHRLPAKIEVFLDHPVEQDNDLLIELNESAPGHYQGELPHRIQHRWYIRIMPVATEPDGDSEGTTELWRVSGELDLSKGNRLTFGGIDG